MKSKYQIKVLALPAFSNRSNPYPGLLYGVVRDRGILVRDLTFLNLLRGKYNIFHIHWPQNVTMTPIYAWACIRVLLYMSGITWLRIRGTKVFWTVHNLSSHEVYHPKLAAAFFNWFLTKLDGYFCLSNEGRRIAEEQFPKLKSLPGFVAVHGHFKGVYPDAISKIEARRLLNLPGDCFAIAHLGLIRPKKNTLQLIDVFDKLSLPHHHLIIAGKAQVAAYSRQVKNACRGNSHIYVKLGHIPNETVQAYLRATDLVVLPYSEVFNSGVAILALSFGKPILIPKHAAIMELAETVGDRWIHTYEGELTTDTLSEAIRWTEQTPRPDEPDLSALDWSPIGEITINAYKEILAGARGDAS